MSDTKNEPNPYEMEVDAGDDPRLTRIGLRHRAPTKDPRGERGDAVAAPVPFVDAPRK